MVSGRGELALLSASVAAFALWRLIRRYGMGAIRRALGTLALGFAMGLATSVMYVGLLFTDSIWRNSPRYQIASLPLFPAVIVSFVVVFGLKNTPRCQRGLFLGGIWLFALGQSGLILAAP